MTRNIALFVLGVTLVGLGAAEVSLNLDWVQQIAALLLAGLVSFGCLLVLDRATKD